MNKTVEAVGSHPLWRELVYDYRVSIRALLSFPLLEHQPRLQAKWEEKEGSGIKSTTFTTQLAEDFSARNAFTGQEETRALIGNGGVKRV